MGRLCPQGHTESVAPRPRGEEHGGRYEGDGGGMV